MSFACIIEISALRRALDAAVAVLPNRSTMPILGHVALKPGLDGKMVMAATDLDRLIEIEVPAVEISGETTLPGRQLRDIAKRFADGCQVKIEATPQSAEIRGGRARARLPVLPFADFPPPMRPGAETTALTLDGKAFAGLLDTVAYAASTDHATRLFCCGARLELRHDQAEPRLRAIAIDGHRMHWTEISVMDASAQATTSVTVPVEALSALSRLAGAAGTVDVEFDRARLMLKAPGVRLVTRLIEATYPDYERIAQPVDEIQALTTLDREELARAVEAALAIATDKGRGVRILIEAESVVVDRADGELEVEMSVRAESRPAEGAAPAYPYAFGVNGGYLAQTLAAVGGDTLDIRLLKSGHVHVSVHGRGEDRSAYALVLPQQLKNGRVAIDRGEPKPTKTKEAA